MEQKIIKDGKKLRYGYTTGSCAAGAAKAALTMLLKKEKIDKINLMTPKGWELSLDIVDIQGSDAWISCAVVKDGGDDPDNTHGMYIYSKVSLNDRNKISLKGGIGVGKVTKKGLPVEKGNPAINPVPRKMILDAAREAAKKFDYHGGYEIEIYAPEGVEIAKKTFNPKLGILGGISILGTTGIVEPMSEKALVESLRLELNILNEEGCKDIILFPGNYAKKFAAEDLKLNIKHSVKISNYIGEVINHLNDLDFNNVLLISHIGKLIKVAGGIMNTHSKAADSRMEILAAYASACGGSSSLTRELLSCITTDEAIDVLNKYSFYNEVLEMILKRVAYHIESRINRPVKIGLIMYTNTHDILGMDENARGMMPNFKL